MYIAIPIATSPTTARQIKKMPIMEHVDILFLDPGPDDRPDLTGCNSKGLSLMSTR